MINEQTPTQYRGTVSIFSLLFAYVLIAAFVIFFSILVLWLSFETVFIISTVPGCLVALIIVIKKLPETKATDLTKVE